MRVRGGASLIGGASVGNLSRSLWVVWMVVGVGLDDFCGSLFQSGGGCALIWEGDWMMVGKWG